MSVIKKFKDFFKSKPKVETEQERYNRLSHIMGSKLTDIKSELEYLFTDFEDLGATVRITQTISQERSFTNGSKLVRPEDSTEVVFYLKGYLKVEIRFGQMLIENISDNLPSEIRRCLIESVSRMNSIPGVDVENARYDSKWTSNSYRGLGGSPKRGDIILIDAWGEQDVNKILNSDWAKDYFRVKLWTNKDKEIHTRAGGSSITGLQELVINIYTKPIEVK